MGVLKARHRTGVGRALVEAARRAAREAGYAFMQVKTVQMGKYAEYDATNRFYLAMGFKEFEVFQMCIRDSSFSRAYARQTFGVWHACFPHGGWQAKRPQRGSLWV